jgi:REP-associated tyrosine transposase
MIAQRGHKGGQGEACVKTGWQAHAYCLMPNHFHLVLETPQPNLVAGMKWFLGTYTTRFNRRHKLFGHLFSGRYKSLIVDGNGNGYLKTDCGYVHLNASRAKLLGSDQPLGRYPWSSWAEYLKAPSRRPGWLRVDRLLGAYQILKWIAERLRMGSVAHVNNRLYLKRKGRLGP